MPKSDYDDSWQNDQYYLHSTEIREKVRSGELLGPDMYLAWNLLDDLVE